MMNHDIVIPSVGESISSASISRWHKKEGEWVNDGELVVSLETDKVSHDLLAPGSGVLHILAKEGDEVSIGAVIAQLDESAPAHSVRPADKSELKIPAHGESPSPASPVPSPSPVSASLDSPAVAPVASPIGSPIGSPIASLVSSPVPARPVLSVSSSTTHEAPPQALAALAEASRALRALNEPVLAPSPIAPVPSSVPMPAPVPVPAPSLVSAPSSSSPVEPSVVLETPVVPVTLEPSPATAPLVEASVAASIPSVPPVPAGSTAPLVGQIQSSPEKTYGLTPDGRVERVRMSPLRRKVASHLVSAQHQAAILTTFNECDMSAVMELRKSLQQEFLAKHGVKLGFMSFFVKAVVAALKAVPQVNGMIEDGDIIRNHFYDVSVAVGTERGLVVPVLRNCDTKSMADIERELVALAEKARKGDIKLEDLQGGVFTISNGGVYGSMLSTPILNPPQSGILGLHAIQDRPVARDGQVVIRPMMYLALSYDHRLIDGKEAVTFLIKVKEFIENPIRLLLEA